MKTQNHIYQWSRGYFVLFVLLVFVGLLPSAIYADTDFHAVPREGLRPLVVDFTDGSDFDASYTRTWSFPGGSPSTATGMTVSNVTYNTAGTYDVTLTISSYGKYVDAETKEDYITVYELIDYGDAPDTTVGSNAYRTKLANDGAAHIINTIYLGATIDAEMDGQQSPAADLDDLHDSNDEDGVDISDLTPGIANEITVVAHNSGYLNAWVDYGRDGDWAEAGDHAVIDQILASGSNTVTIYPPPDALPGQTYARFRISPQGGTSWYGLVWNGEVEDYLIYMNEPDSLDYGDAPAPYPTSFAANGARHYPSPIYYLGDGVATDMEPDAIIDAGGNATGDDDMWGDDENGVTFFFMTPGALGSMSVIAHGRGYLHAWIDFNGNGSWEPAEKVANGELMNAIPYIVNFPVPSDAVPGLTFARIRYSNDLLLDPTGMGSPGEVEDYQVSITLLYDYGDAPAPFPTLFADNGASHPVSQTIYLGDWMPDIEDDGQPHFAALGDDDAGTNDEDGVTTTTLPVSGVVTMPIKVNGRGYLHAWIDFDHSETWDADEKFIDGIPLSSGTYTHVFTMPPDATAGHAFARFRYCLDTSIGPTGVGQAGEVEDYLMNIMPMDAYDYGDAPASYGDAYCVISTENYIGDVHGDAEGGSIYSVGAVGDNTTDTDDEEGIAFGELFVPGAAVNVSYRVHGAGVLHAWFDWNINGDFLDPGEGPFNVGIPPGSVVTDGLLTVTVPIGATPGDSYARFRFGFPEGPVNWGPAESALPVREGDPGEVEDYQITIVEQDSKNDYGDAPAIYETAGAAYHAMNRSIYLGDYIDTEPGAQSHIHALGDDIAGTIDDEDGIHLFALFPGVECRIDVTAHLGPGLIGYLHIWVDFNNNNSWADPGEKIVDGVAAPDGSNTYFFDVPEDAAIGIVMARARYCFNETLGPNGAGGDGEVEDFEIPVVLDYGDAPAPYPDDASHSFNRHFSLGPNFDPEFGPQPSPDADLDDLTGMIADDEDGVSIPLLIAGIPNTITVQVNSWAPVEPTAYLNAWIDFDQNGDWNGLGEHVLTNHLLHSGIYNIGVNVPASALTGETYARFRLSEELGGDPGGFGGVGEVEDYKVVIQDFEADFGDAPDPAYPTLFTHCGPYHMIVDGVYLGDGVSPENNGQPDAEADKDDFDDGVTFLPGDYTPGGFYTFEVKASVEGYLNAWVDLDEDGDWTGMWEQLFCDIFIPAGVTTCWHIPPPWMTAEHLFYRFRFTTYPFTVENYFTGYARDGEVEDYMIDLTEQGPPLGLKWSQPPLLSKQSFYEDAYWGWDEKSVYGDTLLADNWFCGDHRPVKAIRWWGSYTDWDSITPPPEAPDSFHVAIWSDSPVDPIHSLSEPGKVLWEITVSRQQTGESVDGFDFYPGITLTPDSVFRYQINLSAEDQFEQKEDSTYFWLSVAAIYADDVPDEHVWGWTTRETYFLSDAVQVLECNSPAIDSLYREGVTLKSGWDCAFELLADLAERPFDFGDAPDPSYPTSLAGNGAHHYIWSGTSLGEKLDKELNSPGDVTFTWDDSEGTDDEDGITFQDTLFSANDIAFVTVNATEDGILNAWADYNGDGDWIDLGEHVLIDMPCLKGNNNLAFNIASNVSTEEIAMRFRIAPVGGLRSTGLAVGGEVEDMSIKTTYVTAVENPSASKQVPETFELLQNYPNPFNPYTSIPFHLPEMAEVKITIYDILGREVRTLIHGHWSAGSHVIQWDGRNAIGLPVATGMYIYQIECTRIHGQKTLYLKSHKMLLVK